uniref:hypothetical protein n=1 Tax=Mammaliicoccus sciuri TaxID=1296 RepID=UPI00195454AD
VTFSNIQSSGSAFIIQEIDFELCSYIQYSVFEYIGGSVELLNNGYEYRDNLTQGGFIKLGGAFTVLIKDVEFAFNFSIKSYKVSNAGFNQHILTMIDIISLLTVENCTFRSNVLTGLIIFVDYCVVRDLNESFC